jgi:hypothetical protein
MAAQVLAAAREDGVQCAVDDVERDQYRGVDPSVDVERRRLLGIEEDRTQGVRELSARA